MLSHCCRFAVRNGNTAASGGSRKVNSTVKYIRQCVPSGHSADRASQVFGQSQNKSHL
jgi:hypothetical protein